jgi:hypothetical protein
MDIFNNVDWEQALATAILVWVLMCLLPLVFNLMCFVLFQFFRIIRYTNLKRSFSDYFSGRLKF